MSPNEDSGQNQVAQLSPPGERPTWFTYSTGDRPLEGYTIKRGIGSGGFGEVYYAVSDGGKEVALKQIQRHLDVELRGVSQCLNLKHPNLVVLYDVKRSERGENWVVMEFVSGENLAELIERHPQGLPDHEVLSLLRGICDGVRYLHEHGIVHRDLKPGNIFIENDQVKIGDYGLAKFISASRRSGQTESVGTVHYMAPELAHGRYGKEIDLYAVGVIVYEMLTGRVPFHGQSPGEILMKHLTAAPDTSVLPPTFRPIVERLLAKTPEARYPSLEAMLADLDDCLAGRPRVAAVPDRGHHAPRDASAPPVPGADQADHEHHTAGDGYGAGRPVPSLQFWMDEVHGGLSTAEGIIRLRGDALVLDFRVKPLGMVNMAIQEVRIALADLEGVHLNEGWFTTKLVIQTTRPQVLANLPAGGICRATLRIARTSRESARDFIAGVTAAQRGQIAGGERPITLGAGGVPDQPAGGNAAYAGYERARGPARTDRLVRPVDDRIWLGVCSGLAARMGIDPVPIRVLWVLLTVFSGFFMFLFGYLILAMIIPESPAPSPIAPGTGRIRRLVRPRLDRVWAGVCSGFAAYFGIDPVWVRALMVVGTVLTGIFPGLFFYLILCWAMPAGEPVARSIRTAAVPADVPRSPAYFPRVLVRLPIAAFCGIGVGAMAGGLCEVLGSPWGIPVAPLLAIGSGLITVAIILTILCRRLGWPHAYWPAWVTLFGGAGAGMAAAGFSLVYGPSGRMGDNVAAFGGVGSGLLAAGFGGYLMFASLGRSLSWRWFFIVVFLGLGAGMWTGGASALLGVSDVVASLVSVGVGFLVAGSLAWLLILGQWAERLRPATSLRDGPSGAVAGMHQTMTYYGPGVSNRAMILGPSLFLIVLGIAWLGAYAAFWLHGARRPLGQVLKSVAPPAVIDSEVNRFGGHQYSVHALTFDPLGKRLATGDTSGIVKLWDLATNTEIRSITGHNNQINSLAFSPDGTRLAAAADCRDVRVWNVETGEEVCKSIEHAGPVQCVAFSQDGTRLATGSTDDAVRLLDATTGQLVKQFFGCKASIESVAFLPDGARIMAVGRNENQIRIWDIATGRQLKPLAVANGWLTSFVLSPDGRRTAAREFSGTVYVWETESGNRLGSFSTASGDSRHKLAFSPDGSQLLTANWTDVLLRDAVTGDTLCTFKGHVGSLDALSFHPDGNYIITAGSDITVRLWEIPSNLQRPVARRRVESRDAAEPAGEMEIPLGDASTVEVRTN